jgi:hypothetical protein
VRGVTHRPLWLAAVLAVAFVAILLALEWFAPTPGGPAGSSYATAPAGAAAYAELLRRDGRDVERVREPLAEAGGIETLVVLEPEHVDPEEAAAIGARVRDGMRLVAGGGATGWLRDVVAEPPAKGGGAPGRAEVTGPAPETEGVAAVDFRRGGVWAQLGQTEPLLATEAGPVAVAAGQGDGRVVLLADPTPLLNGALADADNAAFALDAAGPAGRPAAFLETIHGFRDTGLAALPDRALWALLGLAIAALLYVWSMARRLGPAEDEERELAPPRRDYAEALAAALGASGDEAGVRAEAERRGVGRAEHDGPS